MKNSRLLKRQKDILQILAQHDSVSVRVLAETLEVSGWTVRRDLARMVQEGLVQKKHGAVSLAVGQVSIPFDTFEKRSRENLTAKQNIATAVAQLLKPNQNVVMGAGTTTTQVALSLAQLPHKSLHIMTNALNIAMDLAQYAHLQVTCTGGDVGSDHYTLTGPVAERALRAHYYDVAVIGVSGLTVKEGLTVNGRIDSIPLQIMIEQSRQLIVVADASKVGQVHFAHLAPLSQVDVLVMDRAEPASFCEALTQMDITLLRA